MEKEVKYALRAPCLQVSILMDVADEQRSMKLPTVITKSDDTTMEVTSRCTAVLTLANDGRLKIVEEKIWQMEGGTDKCR